MSLVLIENSVFKHWHNYNQDPNNFDKAFVYKIHALSINVVVVQTPDQTIMINFHIVPKKNYELRTYMVLIKKWIILTNFHIIPCNFQSKIYALSIDIVLIEDMKILTNFNSSPLPIKNWCFKNQHQWFRQTFTSFPPLAIKLFARSKDTVLLETSVNLTKFPHYSSPLPAKNPYFKPQHGSNQK